MANDPARTAYTSGLRELAEWLDTHPEVPLPYLGGGIPGCDLPTLAIYIIGGDRRQQLATIARAMGHAEKAVSEHRDGGASFQIWRRFAGIALFAQADRDLVCERVITGTRQVETDEVIEPAKTRKVKKTVEAVEWRCPPLLAQDGAS